MRIVQCTQGSQEWHDARLGIPTASCFDKILTPAKLEPSRSADAYLHGLIAEWLIGEPVDDAASSWMERGTDLEDRAAAWYEWEQDVKLSPIGFCLHDEVDAGCSPDRMRWAIAGESFPDLSFLRTFDASSRVIEIKCPAAKTHVGYLLDGVGSAYRLQAQGQLWITGCERLDLVIWNPIIDPIVIQIERDDEAIAKIDEHVRAFCDLLEGTRIRLQDVYASCRARRAARDESQIPVELLPMMGGAS